MEKQAQLDQICALLTEARGLLSTAFAGERGRLEKAQALTEQVALKLGALNDSLRPREPEPPGKPALRPFPTAGSLEVNEFGWVHIALDTLLPHCRYRTPEFLQTILSRLMEEHIRHRGRLPWFEKALLVIDEHCDIRSRQVYDQDNKGYKAIPNAIKGVMVPDDDQFTLELALLSTLDERPSCQIYLLPAEEAGEFFSLRSGQYGVYL